MTSKERTPSVASANAVDAVRMLVQRERSAMADFADSDQERVDEVVTALAWSLYQLEHARELAEIAVRHQDLGNPMPAEPATDEFRSGGPSLDRRVRRPDTARLAPASHRYLRLDHHRSETGGCAGRSLR